MNRPAFIREMGRLESELAEQSRPRWVASGDGSTWRAYRPGVDWVESTLDVMDGFVRVRSHPHGLYGPSVSVDIPFDDFLAPRPGFRDR